MRIGIYLGEARGPDAIGDFEARIGQAADDGFASAFVSHIFGVDSLIALAVAGRAVPGIELGTAVIPTYTRHPVLMAQQALSAQVALDGRLVLGIGLSHQLVIEHMYGLSFERPLRHMREYLSVLLPLLREGRVSFHGETVHADVGLGVPGASPMPVLVAALGPRMLDLAGRVADGTVTWMTGVATLRDHTVPAITAAAADAGRPPPRVVCGLPVCVTDDAEAARERAAKVYGMYGQLPSYRAMLDREGAAGPADVAVVGDEAAVREQLLAIAEAGVTDFVAAEFAQGDDADRTRALLKTLV